MREPWGNRLPSSRLKTLLSCCFVYSETKSQNQYVEQAVVLRLQTRARLLQLFPPYPAPQVPRSSVQNSSGVALKKETVWTLLDPSRWEARM